MSEKIYPLKPEEVGQAQIESPHYLLFKTGDQFHDRDLYFVSISGIAAKTNLTAKGDSEKGWKHYKLKINADIPTARIPTPAQPTPGGDYQRVFYAKHWTLQAGLNNIYNKGQANSSGHAVDSFNLNFTLEEDLEEEQEPTFSLIGDQAQIECILAVQDTDAHLHQVGFKLDLLVCFVGFAEIK